MSHPASSGRWRSWNPPEPTPPLIAAVLDALARLAFACAVEEVDAVRAAFAARTGARTCELVEPGARIGLTDLFGTGRESTRDAALSWDQLAGLVPPGPMADELRALTGDRIAGGLACPVTGSGGCRAVLLVLFERPVAFSSAEADLLVLLAQGLWLCLTRLRREAEAARPVALTAREAECLTWVLEGKTNWEIGVMTGVAPRTVQFHLANAARKLDATNRVQAGVKALMAGLIPPPRGLAWPHGGPQPGGPQHSGPHTGSGASPGTRPAGRPGSSTGEAWVDFEGLTGAARCAGGRCKGAALDAAEIASTLVNDDTPPLVLAAAVPRLASGG